MKKNLWRGLSAVMAFLLMLSIFGGQIANTNAGGINNFLGISGATVVSNGTFASSYGEITDENLEKLIADEMAFCIEQLEEGAVLLKKMACCHWMALLRISASSVTPAPICVIAIQTVAARRILRVKSI